MNSQQKLFCEMYLTKNYGNATQSAISAGYSEKTAYSQGQRLLNHVEVKKYLAKRKEELFADMMADHHNTMNKINMLANFNIKDLYDNKGNLKLIKDLPPEVAYCISSTETRLKKDGEEWDTVTNIKTESKIKALEQLAKIQKLYEDKIPGNLTIRVIIDEDE